MVRYDEFMNEYKNFDFEKNSVFESGLSRIINRIKINSDPFFIMSGYHKDNTQNTNRVNHGLLLNYLNSKNLGAYNLIGYWSYDVEDTENISLDGGCELISENKVRCKEESFMVVKNQNVGLDEFRQLSVDMFRDKNEIIIKTSKLDSNQHSKRILQEGIIYSDGSKIELWGWDDEIDDVMIYETFVRIDINKLSVAYSKLKNKTSASFLFKTQQEIDEETNKGNFTFEGYSKPNTPLDKYLFKTKNILFL